MKQHNGFRLITLGRIALVGPNGAEDDSLGTRRRKLALLAMLALSHRPIPRDALIEMFWGDQDESRARHSLSDALSHIRRVLGRDALTNRSSEVALQESAGLVVDSEEMADAVGERDFARAVKLYGGPFLDAVYVDGSASWEQWVTRERVRLEGMFLQACEKECMGLARSRKWEECGQLAQRWLDTSPVSTDAALYLLNALKSPGTREADQRALAEYRRLEALLDREFELAPAPPVVALAKSIAERIAEAGARELAVERPAEAERAVAAPPVNPIAVPGAARAEVRASVGAAEVVERGEVVERAMDPGSAGRSESARGGGPPRTAENTAAPPGAPYHPVPIPPAAFPANTAEFRASRVVALPANTAEWRVLRDRLSGGTPRPRSLRASRWPILVGAGLLLIAIALGVYQYLPRRAEAGGALGHPAVAIAAINSTGDSATAWLREGLPQMIAARLARSSMIDIVAPERVRETRARAELAAGVIPSPQQLADLGRRLGAAWVVSGAVSRGDSLYVLDVNVREVSTGRLVKLDVVQAADPVSLADAAAAKILDAAGAASDGPRLADIETSNVDAYERYTRAMAALGEGRLESAIRELDAAIALDSGFVSAIRERRDWAQSPQDRARFQALFDRYKGRATDFDRYQSEIWVAHANGEHERSEALARAFVARYPRDPRAYNVLSDVYNSHGKFEESAQALRAELALDSLALEAGHGACAPCGAYRGLVYTLWFQGKLDEAVAAGRRWVQLQPNAPAALVTLGKALMANGQLDDAMAAVQRAEELSPSSTGQSMLQRGHILLAMHDLDGAQRLAEQMLRGSRDERAAGFDLQQLVLRERGQMRAYIRWQQDAMREFPDEFGSLELVRGHAMGELREYPQAIAFLERHAHGGGPQGAQQQLPLEPSGARGFSWAHALLADAVAPALDSAALASIADTVALVSRRSYFARDWYLADYIRGLALQRAGHLEAAADAYRRSIFEPMGFTRTQAHLAEIALSSGRPADALAELRTARGGDFDGMARYQTRSGLDLLTARAFRALGQADSASYYAGLVRRAWRDADPEIRARLADLER